MQLYGSTLHSNFNNRSREHFVPVSPNLVLDNLRPLKLTASKRDHALELVKKDLYVIPLCWPRDGVCACGRNHQGHDIGKAPLTPKGVNDSSNAVRQVWEWWERWPEANPGVDLDRSGLLVIGPDSGEWHETFQLRGLPETATVRSGGGDGHQHYYYRRPAGTPLININKPAQYDIMPRGYMVAAGSMHQSGRAYQWETTFPWRDVEDLPAAPEWALAEVQEKWAQRTVLPQIDISPDLARLDLTSSDEVLIGGERLDRSLTLFLEGSRLARAGATALEIIATLREIDETRGYFKYSRRRDGGAKEYSAIAERAVQQRDTAPGSEFTFNEIAAMLGGGIAEPFHKDGSIPREKVCRRLSSNPVAPRSTTETPTKPGDTVWNCAFELFPVIKGLVSRGKHILAINEHSQTYIAYTVYSTSWVGNVQNHNHKRRQAYAGISPKLNTWGPWYGMDVPVDDLGDDGGESKLEAWQTATRRARPENGHLLAINNRIAIGCERYLSNVQHEGFVEVTDHQEWLVASLRAIRPPGKGDQSGKFYPIHGTGDIKKAAEKPADEDFNRLRSVATQENNKLDLVDVEAEARDLGLEPEHDSGRFKRAQCSDGYLKGHYTDIRQVLKLARCFGDGRLTEYGRELAAANSPLQIGPAVKFKVDDLRHAEEIAVAAGMTLKPVGKKQSANQIQEVAV